MALSRSFTANSRNRQPVRRGARLLVIRAAMRLMSAATAQKRAALAGEKPQAHFTRF
jgi:hypothetical protein